MDEWMDMGFRGWMDGWMSAPLGASAVDIDQIALHIGDAANSSIVVCVIGPGRHDQVRWK